MNIEDRIKRLYEAIDGTVEIIYAGGEFKIRVGYSFEVDDRYLESGLDLVEAEVEESLHARLEAVDDIRKKLALFDVEA